MKIAPVAAAASLALISLFSQRTARSQAEAPLFDAIVGVLQSPRCMNCHPSGDAPLQTDASRPHKQNIQRAFVDLGGSCQTCHQDAEMPGDHMPPGALHWNLPPPTMAFQGKTPAALCADLQDETKNGGRSLDALVHHVSTDPLVLWGFDPGPNRTPPPMTHAAFVALMTDWVAEGAPCPN